MTEADEVAANIVAAGYASRDIDVARFIASRLCRGQGHQVLANVAEAIVAASPAGLPI